MIMIYTADNYITTIFRHMMQVGLGPSTKVGRENVEYMIYTMRHKVAFINTYSLLVGKPGSMEYQHDADKLLLYSLYDKPMVHKKHSSDSNHHYPNCKTRRDKLNCIIDYECARLTKPDKPLNAYNTIMKYRPESYNEYKSLLSELGIDSPINIPLDESLGNTLSNEAYVRLVSETISVINKLGGFSIKST